MFKYILTLTLLSLIFLGCSSDDNDTDTASTSSPLSGECNTQIYTSSNPTTLPMLVVLVSYNDVQISSSITTWNSKMFGKNESELNHYYDEISSSQFEFSQATECNGVASVHLNKNHPNISIDSLSFDSLVYPDLKASLEALDNNISFDIYDTDANGHITPNELLVTFIIAGYEDAYEGKHVNQGIWAHQSCINSTGDIPTLDGVTIMGCANDGNYALFGERHEESNPHDATIGIIAHELGHSAFNLPDLYNTDNPNSGGIGYFGLMGAGTWAQKNNTEYPGDTPVHMTAWSKVYNGWVTPDNSSGSKIMNATNLNSFNTVKVPINDSEYYLLENRNNAGYDRGLFVLDGTFNGGLAIWRINETQLTTDKLNSNEVNTDNNNKGVDLVEAANSVIDSGGVGNEKNLFYSGNVDKLEVDANITNIGERAENMLLNVN
ncbi:MAG: M6 family metalloprotease domain-containing protein [Thiovulaceae bacterium]|nr:M6 family metalloprotease domain-containing protein [Sulfurimonadaceae bacterium]